MKGKICLGGCAVQVDSLWDGDEVKANKSIYGPPVLMPAVFFIRRFTRFEEEFGRLLACSLV